GRSRAGAQTGGGLTGGGRAQPLARAGEISAWGGRAAGGCACRGWCRGVPLHAAAASETATTASMAANRHLISRRYAGRGAAPSRYPLAGQGNRGGAGESCALVSGVLRGGVVTLASHDQNPHPPAHHNGPVGTGGT